MLFDSLQFLRPAPQFFKPKAGENHTDEIFAVPLALMELREAVNRLLKPAAGTDPTHP